MTPAPSRACAFDEYEFHKQRYVDRAIADSKGLLDATTNLNHGFPRCVSKSRKAAKPLGVLEMGHNKELLIATMWFLGIGTVSWFVMITLMEIAPHYEQWLRGVLG